MSLPRPPYRAPQPQRRGRPPGSTTTGPIDERVRRYLRLGPATAAEIARRFGLHPRAARRACVRVGATFHDRQWRL